MWRERSANNPADDAVESRHPFEEDMTAKCRHSREGGNPCIFKYLNKMDSCLRRNDTQGLSRLFAVESEEGDPCLLTVRKNDFAPCATGSALAGKALRILGLFALTSSMGQGDGFECG